MPYTISAVDRALALLEALAENPGLSVTELAKVSGNTKSLVFRLIFTLEQRGYVIKDPATRTYTLGYRPLFLASSAQDNVALIKAAAPFLDDLARSSGQHVNLLVRDGVHSLCVALRTALDSGRLYAQVGRRGPLHAGGGPKILLAFAPREVRDEVLAGPLRAFTPNTITDPAELAARLAAIRETGRNESRGDLDVNAFSFASAIHDAEGEVIAAVSCAGRLDRLPAGSEPRLRDLVDEAASRISEAMGWRQRFNAAVG
ncbi:IclR family transcriptional regulator [Alsobacter sp. SYSU M60028]|uniref:IclR family transcriptional regulator n=1 Tax=Alsobacter ponti TaxID=2962936 RepID=A0ABT1LFV0_9HYPH|nr:IclR family transcriptional regulator [Alsobacter ponti]MCP8940372.1 IclR family transcriptional regulator [Alsobacter ponti]